MTSEHAMSLMRFKYLLTAHPERCKDIFHGEHLFSNLSSDADYLFKNVDDCPVAERSTDSLKSECFFMQKLARGVVRRIFSHRDVSWIS